jgi:hypothetical protein
MQPLLLDPQHAFAGTAVYSRDSFVCGRGGNGQKEMLPCQSPWLRFCLFVFVIIVEYGECVLGAVQSASIV